MQLTRMKTVDDMYKNSVSRDVPLLSDYSAPFWAEYVANYSHYDALFRRLYYSFRYFGQDYGDSVETVTVNFTNEVYHHLMVNAKKYSELYRVNVVDDADYSIVNNYSVKETLNKETSRTDSDVYGNRTDHIDEMVGARADTSSVTSGKRTDTNDTKVGSQINTGTNTIAGFNSAGFENDNKVLDELGARNDTSTTTIGEKSDSTTTNIGEQNNITSFDKGSQSDSHTGSGKEEYTLSRVGNIGIKTATAIMKEHVDFWSIYEFYTYIFKEICAELLLI